MGLDLGNVTFEKKKENRTSDTEGMSVIEKDIDRK